MMPVSRSLAFKRAIDLVLGSALLALFALPMGVVALIVRLRLGTPVLFRQQRPGRHGRPFSINKFRTMVDASTGATSPPLSDEARMTETGRILRRTSFDELPELLNVLKGDMSLVGPRPLLPEYLERYSPHQARRHDMRPGMTGWAQVNGRNAISWEERFDLDVWYIDNWSVGLDLRILARTLAQVVNGEGVSADGHATMPEFLGSDEGGDLK